MDMEPERWRRVEDLYHRALEMDAARVAEFLQESCGDDTVLRREVESLLAREKDAEHFIESPALEVMGKLIARERVPAGGEGRLIGSAVSHYRVIAELGAGGMGVVYRAKDTKLKREVALKMLPAYFARDPERMARFQREAEVLASLNHHNIAAIYGLTDSRDARALVMELVEGETLPKGVALDSALYYAKQIADALEYAHERGVIHRDLKPANVKVTSEGTVKLLDFGLAKAIEDPAAPRGDPANSPTVTLGPTRVGVILGTAAYMSPEQASGKTADRRADVWSFGAVLYEMLSGKRPFEGESVSDTLAMVLKVEPDWNALPEETPASIRRLVQRCLTKDRKQRLQAIGEARIAIEEALAGGSQQVLEAAPEPSGARGHWLPWGLATLLTVGLASVAFLHLREKPAVPGAPVRFEIPAPENTTLTPILNLSPDGRKLAFLVYEGDIRRLWVHSLESGESRELTAVDGSPFWSPDSRFIGYPFQNELKKIEATGGPPQTLANLPGPWATGAWNQDGVIVFGVFGSAAGLFRVPSSGGVPVQITALDPARRERVHYMPSFLPDGQHFVYTRFSDEEKSAIYLGSVDAKPEQQNAKPLLASKWGAVYAPSADPRTGYLLFMREHTLWAQPFDNRRAELTGQATAIAGQVGDNRGGKGGYGAFTASTNDVLAFLRSAMSDQQLTWVDSDGKILGTPGEPGDYQGLALSPDGTRLAFSKSSGTGRNIWLLDLTRGTSTRFTFDSAKDEDPVWSPDGSRIVFASNRDGGQFNLYQKLVSGVKEEEVLLKSAEDKWPTSWSRDGRFLLYDTVHPKTKVNTDIWMLPLDGDKKPAPFLVTEFSESDAHFSPDGHYVAYTSEESGQPAVYVRSFSPSFSVTSAGTPTETGGKWKVSDHLGLQPRWRGDGQALYYRSLSDGKVMAVEIATHPAFRAGKPRPLGIALPIPPAWPDLGSLWDSAADGKSFLTLTTVTRKEPYTVVLNWQAGLKK
jgi:eukaryotic-like serine/threonine-protein kinase